MGQWEGQWVGHLTGLPLCVITGVPPGQGMDGGVLLAPVKQSRARLHFVFVVFVFCSKTYVMYSVDQVDYMIVQ